MHTFKKKNIKNQTITRKQYPEIFQAFDLIIADNVVSSAITKKIKTKLKKGFKIKDREINPAHVERFLSALDMEGIELLTMGDQDEVHKAFDRFGYYKETDVLMNEFFESI